MIPPTDETHRRESTSWIKSANQELSDFPIQNLPFGVFCAPGTDGNVIGVAIGDSILNLKAAESVRCLDGLGSEISDACRRDSLNQLMTEGANSRRRLRRHLFRLLHESAAPEIREAAGRCLVPAASAHLQIPARIGDYTDFYASIFHATNVGSLFRPENPLLANYKWLPIGYHGRASSIVISGSSVRRPQGQFMPENASVPEFGPSRALDYELEIGAYVADGNALGEPIAITEAETRIFGLCLVNDWSARDIQSWEYQPLGPFLGKSFATTISPWVITTEALAPYRCPACSRPAGDPEPVSYLDSKENRESGGFDITLEVNFSSARMRKENISPIRLSQGHFREMYWTLAQMFAHHSSNGCNLRPGDLIATGTISGPSPDLLGCLLEITRRGKAKLRLPTGEERTFLQDDDEVMFRAWCEAPGFARIGFGECRGRIQSS
jgi:fumarylacetoacetase